MKNGQERPVVSMRRQPPTLTSADSLESTGGKTTGVAEPRGQSYAATTDTPCPEKPDRDLSVASADGIADQQELMKLMVDPDNMQRAWEQVRRNQGSPGVDGMTIDEFPDWIQLQWPAISQQLLDGTYRPQPVRRVAIDKPDGGQRLLGIPNVVDRVIQQAITRVLTPIFDPEFSESSFGFRPNRSAHGAIKQAQSFIRSGKRYVVDVDLSKFFDRVQHDILMSRVARKVRDKVLLKLIGRYLRAGVMIGGIHHRTPEGTPQGGPLSPLLSNILLDDLDKELERRQLPFARYADDFVIFVSNYRAACKVMASVPRYVTGKLKLQVNERKSAVRRADETEFLGFAFRTRKANLNVTSRNMVKLKQCIREITARNRGVSFERMVGELSRYLRGWMGYFALDCRKQIWSSLDGWIRRRVRMYLWKQWRLPRTRIRGLKRLGVDDFLSRTHGASRKGYWRLSKTLGGHIGMTKQWLRDQGLVFLRYLWGDLARLRRTA